MRQRGTSLLELLFVVFLLLLIYAAAAPTLRAASIEAHIRGAVDQFKGDFLKARSAAARSGVYTAIRFEHQADGVYVSVYADGNHNGVQRADIERGIDRRISGPRRLDGGAPGVRVGILPGLPAPPPERGPLDTADPIRFGRGDMVSFSPLGTATPGTFYLAGEGVQGAVRVTGETARVRTLICRGKRWSER